MSAVMKQSANANNTKSEKYRLLTAAAVYAVIFAMNIAGLPRVTCDMGNHFFVLLCLLFCILDWTKLRDNLLLLFMVFTFAADVLSGFTPTFAAGVVFFFASQITMSFMIWRNNGGRHMWAGRVLLIAAMLAILYAFGLLNPMYAFGAVYFMWFVGNAIQAAAAKDWDNTRVRAAMGLYILGDICLIGNLLFPNAGSIVSTIFTYGTWIPYLPAVYLIATSMKTKVNP